MSLSAISLGLIVHPESPWTNVLRPDASCGCVRPHTGRAFVCVRLRASACVCVRCVRASKYIYVCVRVRASASACERLRPRACVCVRVRASAFVCVQTIKSPDASRRKWISASGRVFCSRTFGMYYRFYTSRKGGRKEGWQVSTLGPGNRAASGLSCRKPLGRHWVVRV